MRNISILLCVCAAFSQVIADTLPEEFIAIPLKKSESIIRTSVDRNELNTIQSENTISSSRRLAKEKLVNFQNTFIGEIGLGTPAQNLSVLFDTGSAPFWVFSTVLCRITPTKCKGHRFYDHCKSKSYQPDGRGFRVDYGIGFTVANLSRDILSIGNLEAKGQLFGEATDVDEGSVNSEYDGIFGLTYTPIPLRNNTFLEPPIYTLFKQKQIKKAVFAFFLTDNNSKKQPELAIGGADPTKFKGNFIFTRVVDSQDEWVITVDKVTIGNSEFKTSINAAPDTGTNGFVFTKPMLDSLVSQSHATYSKTYDFHIVDCNKLKSLPKITITISNHPFTFTGEEYVIEFIDDSIKKKICFVGALGFEDSLVLGFQFLKKYYTLFNGGDQTVGFAVAVQ